MYDDEVDESVEWRPVVGFPKYSVSNQGDIFNEETQRMVRTQLRPNGKLAVSLFQAFRASDKKLVDHLVAEAFLPTPMGGTRWRKLRHIDNDLLNNEPGNLEWE